MEKQCYKVTYFISESSKKLVNYVSAESYTDAESILIQHLLDIKLILKKTKLFIKSIENLGELLK